MAADIQKIIKKLKQAKEDNVIGKLAAILVNINAEIDDKPRILKTAEQLIQNTPHNGVAIRNVSSEQKFSKTHELILFCNQKLDAMQDHLDDLIANLALNPIEPSAITAYCEKFFRDYSYFNVDFCLLLKAIQCHHEQQAILWDLKLLEKSIHALAAIYARPTDVLTSSPNEPVFSMDNDDFAGSSSPYSSDSSNPADSVDSNRGISNSNEISQEKVLVYSASFFSRDSIFQKQTSSSSKTEHPQKSLSAQSQKKASPDKKESLDAIHLLSEMQRLAEYLFDNIIALCDAYKKLLHGKKDELYTSTESRLIKIAGLIGLLEKSLKIRTGGHIRNDLDCSEYEENIKNIVKEMRGIIQNPILEKEIGSIREYIRHNTVNRESETQREIRDTSERSYSCYTRRKEELGNLCKEIGSVNGEVRLDIEEIRETVKKQIVDDVFGPIEIEPRTYSLKSAKPCEKKECSSNSQIFLPQKKTSAAEKPRRKQAAVESASREITPAAQFGPLIFTKESFKK
jgi:hypothetical protein